jgi:O-antigen ligase/polysaccharide polymerase Wzy-like membrane protein
LCASQDGNCWSAEGSLATCLLFFKMYQSSQYLSDTETPLEWSSWVLLLVVGGYVTMTRSFAHLGQTPIYIGEMTLLLLFVLWPGMILGTWFRAQARSSAYTQLATLAAVFVAYGCLQCLRGLSQSAYPKTAVQNFALNYYVVFLFAGMCLGELRKNLLPRMMWYLAWANAIYGVPYLLKFGYLLSNDERNDNLIQVGWPAGGAVAILGLLAFERGFRRIVVPAALNAFVMLGCQVRAEWFACTLAVTLLCTLRGRLRQLILGALVVGVIIFVSVVVDVKIPTQTGYDGELSARDIVGRAIAAVDEDAASQVSEHASIYAGTVSWRTEWWKALLKETHKTTFTTLFGMGYGYPIWDHNDFLNDEIVPTPHNIFIYVLTYTGWVGVCIFYALQLSLGWALWKAYQASGQPFGLCLWVLFIFWAHFDNRLETPYGAIPFWVLLGMALTSASSAAGEGRAKLESFIENRRFHRTAYLGR